MKVEVYKIPQNSPDDLSQLDALIQSGKIDPYKFVAILGKTEGNGCVNDFTRGFAVQTLKTYIQDKANLEVAQRIVYVMSGGTEGVLSPHLNIFTRDDRKEPQHWGLVIGISRTRDFLPTEIGTLEMVQEVAKGVEAAIADAELNKSDVHFVQIKCPLISSTQLQDKSQVKASNSYQSMAYSRGASALGVAVALGEVAYEQLTATDICANYSLYSRVASTSAGVELRNCEILVLGNSPHSTSNFVIGHSVMQHALDREAICQAIENTNQPIERVVNIFAKAEADPSGFILGRRHTMLDDSDINHTRMARSVVGAVTASVVQDPMVYVSGGSEHQGPPGGGPVVAIAQIIEHKS
ncbi:ring-opening amidohydrolase [Gloeocapsopsis crepidinum LEGE 06123]|uniref:Cyanuric acid amidohydrolase n=1 Tax=Gloeocapsopsis crepidinum LEGE 06123 TaxID=588587 RepID=A0ABR9USN4_9CHRO|nr:ring-opening amidohydrolase [Gloeocapsopsis crepidinum]MBE9191286.1 ring-opening amidohydrolase [Gloeocapsopsis crepidinum LEGE 06123]